MRSSVAFLVSILSLAGCGGDDSNKHLADAPPGADAKTIDGAVLPVTLTITQDGAPMVGVHVYFTNADSTPVGADVTDANGTVSKVMAAGGFVTAVDPFVSAVALGGTNDSLQTFAGVAPGDHLQLVQDNTSTPVTFTVVGPVEPNATSYYFLTGYGFGQLLPGSGGAGSGDPTPGGTVTLYDCPGTADVLVTAYDVNGALISSFYHPALAISEGAAIDLSTETFTAATDATYAYTNVPDAYIYTQHLLASAEGVLDFYYGNADATTGAGMFTLRAPAAPGVIGITDSRYDTNMTTHGVVDWGAAGGDYALDFTGLILPDFADRPVFDVPSHAVSWTPDTTAGALAPDFAVTDVQVYRTSASRSWVWTIAAPYAAGKVTFPTLPTDLKDFNVVADDSFNTNTLRTAKVPGGWDAVREHVFSLYDPTDFAGAGGSGRVEYANLFSGKLARHSFFARATPHGR